MGKKKPKKDTTKSKKSKEKKSKAKQPKSKQTMAEKADRHNLYQLSVQHADHEVEFFEKAFRAEFRRKPYVLREDFCGTYSVCCEWVKSHNRRSAIGVDLCGDTLAWGNENNASKLTGKQRDRLTVLEQDVRKKNNPRADVLAAQNFSFWYFKTRQEVIDYFKIARANLNDEGVMVMDMMGGGGCLVEGQVDKRTIKKGKNGFKYHWEQARFNPITSDCSFYIHFKFPDGSKLKRAFEYHWRFWTIPEVREMLEEAGFSASFVYWEEEDDDGDATGEWVKMAEVPNQEAWICYLVAVR